MQEIILPKFLPHIFVRQHRHPAGKRYAVPRTGYAHSGTRLRQEMPYLAGRYRSGEPQRRYSVETDHVYRDRPRIPIRPFAAWDANVSTRPATARPCTGVRCILPHARHFCIRGDLLGQGSRPKPPVHKTTGTIVRIPAAVRKFSIRTVVKYAHAATLANTFFHNALY